MNNESKRRLLNRVERLGFALGILLIVGLANYYRSLPAFTTDSPASDPNVLLTSPVTDSIVGFGGPTPARITLDPHSGTIQSIEFLPNAEDFEYWAKIEESGVLDKYLGKTPGEAASLSVDAVSGATDSARSAQETLRKRLLLEEGRIGDTAVNQNWNRLIPMPDRTNIFVIILLSANFVFAFSKSNPRTKLWLSIANAVVLGFISYSYLSFARIAGWVNTAPHWRFSIPFVLLLVVVGFALLKGRNIYCTHICPYGCAQDLATRTGKRFGVSVWKVSFRYGSYIRRLLLNIGILALVCGLAFRPPEPFSIFQMTGSRWILVLGVSFIVLAVFMPRLWCRWLCPCGALLDHFSHHDKKQLSDITEKENDF